MDIFQGWYKDGTAGTRDYRPFSALYMLYRIMLSCELIVQMLSDNYHSGLQEVLGILNIFLGMVFFTLQPYKQKWMNHFDGWIIVLIGVLLMLETIDNKSVFIIGGVTGLSVVVLLLAYVAYQNTKCS